MVGKTPGPIGKPIIYQPIKISNQVTEIIKQYGKIILIAPNIPIGLSLSWLYIFINAIKITKNVDRGVIPLVIESAALKTNCKNWGAILNCIKGGT